jgi:hypothetical protein
MSNAPQPSRLLALFVAMVVVGGSAVLGAALISWDGDDLPLVVVLAMMAVAFEYFDFGPYPNSRVSLSIGAITTAAIVAGFPGIAIVCTAAVAAQYAAHPKPPLKVAFNEGTHLLAGAAALGVFRAFGDGYGAGEWPRFLAPALLGGAAFFAVNSALVAIAIAIDKRMNPVTVWTRSFSWIAPHYILVGMIAAAMATAYDEWNLAGLGLPLVPLLMVWVIMKQRATPVRTAAAAGAG